MCMTTFMHLKPYTWNILKHFVKIKGLGNTRNLHTSIIHQWKLEQSIILCITENEWAHILLYTAIYYELYICSKVIVSSS